MTRHLLLRDGDDALRIGSSNGRNEKITNINSFGINIKIEDG
jgi:hypothetical protein